MIQGMTGFGSAEIFFGKIKGIIEIKSQNHRYFDLVYYLPPGFGSIENKIRGVINKSIKRGRVAVSVKITEKPLFELMLNREAVQIYLKYSKMLQKEFGLNNNLSLSDLIKLPGVFESREVVIDGEKLWPMIEKCLKQALKSVMNMRMREGRSLALDFSAVLKRMIEQIVKIQSRAKIILQEKKGILSPEEFLSFQKGCAINEEITRLKHYILEFKSLINSKAGIGKKLDFVAQEMQRETNTIGAKLQDQIVSTGVIALKSKIEALREQAQNIE